MRRNSGKSDPAGRGNHNGGERGCLSISRQKTTKNISPGSIYFASFTDQATLKMALPLASCDWNVEKVKVGSRPSESPEMPSKGSVDFDNCQQRFCSEKGMVST